MTAADSDPRDRTHDQTGQTADEGRDALADLAEALDDAIMERRIVLDDHRLDWLTEWVAARVAEAEQQATDRALARVVEVLDECDARTSRTPDRVLSFWTRRLRAAVTPEARDAHDRRVKAEALREAADAFETQQRNIARREQRLAPWTDACTYLFDRADRIERGNQ